MENLKIAKAYSRMCRVDESDVLHRSPSRVIQQGPDYIGNIDDERTLDGRINLRGRAEGLRDSEVSSASHISNIQNCYEYSKDVLERLAKDLYNEKQISLSYDVERILSELEELAEDFDSNYRLKSLKSDVRKPYHVGGGMLGDPNYVGHEKFEYR